MLHDQMIDEIVCQKLKVKVQKANLSQWRKITKLLDQAIYEMNKSFS